MTDSMKFGPEWLRNMSADNTNSNLLSSVGTSLSNSGNVMTTSFSNNGGNGSGSFGITSNVSSTATTPYSFALAPRNAFPEFRYGREEMLSLFDKNYNMPEILPTFKKIFIEKVQLPLALTPSTDEELLPQVSPVSTRQSWILRSPVGFSSSTRGAGRGGSVDRGRMRGKPNYHQIYQRPTAVFGDDDPRSVPLKSDRGWSERNGGGDSLNPGGAYVCGIGGSNSEWNSTPTSSPRKDISGHPRNMENWRRNRNEDGSGDASTSSLSNTEGWRGGSATGGSFVATHRWGRSTSWRDEDMSSTNSNDVGYVNSSGSTMQRSHSNIMTVNERGGYVPSNSGSNSAKPPPNSYGPTGNQNSNRTFSSLSGLSAVSSRNPHWNNSSGPGCSSAVDGEENLPEWAMENPLDGGGTFDASGAFHGSVDEGDNEEANKQCRKKTDSRSGSSARNNEGNNVKESKSSEPSTGKTGSSFKNDNSNSNVTKIEVAMKLSEEISSDSKIENSAVVTDTLVSENAALENPDGLSKIQGERKPDLCNRIVISEADTLANTSYYKSNINDSISKSNTATTASNNDSGHPDLSDRMREVTDDMIQKLIMDDDTISINDNNAQNEIQQNTTPPLVQVTVATSIPAVNNLCAPNVFTTVSAILKQPPHQTIPCPVSVSSSLTTLTEDGLHKGIQLYGGGVVIDHATMQHHHMQQQQIAAAAAAAANLTTGCHASHSINSNTSSAAPADLWYYRDPQSKVQGPFSATEMTEWYRAGYFNENLFVRRSCDMHFRSLGDLIKLCNDNMPFTHSHLIPNLDNMPLPNAASGSARQSQKPQSIGDYALKQQSPQQGEQRDQLKGNINCVNYLGEAVKNIMPVDVSNVYFQMLRHQEMLMYNELIENECFQQLTPSEKEALVRQKLQMHSEYIPNLSGLSNSLAAINQSAARARMYDVIMEEPKKNHLFSGSGNPGSLNTHQHSQSNPFLDHEDFLINSQQTMQTIYNTGPFRNALPTGRDNSVPVNNDKNGNELINNFNMGMYLPSANCNPSLIPNPKTQDFLVGANADFLNDSHILVARNSLAPNSLVHPWASNNSQQPSNEWTNNLLVGIPITVTQSSSNKVENVNNMTQDIQQPHPQKNIPTPMWNLPSLNHIQIVEAKQLDTESSKSDFENQRFLKVQASPNEQLSAKETQSGSYKSVDGATEDQLDISIQTRQQNSPTVVKPIAAILTKHRKDEIIEKYQNGSTKRIGKQQTTGNKSSKGSEDFSSGKKFVEERRRDQVEDKRRQKEEKKRHQADEEKRRQQHMDEEKRRQMLEEKERQQQIQTQRRKAMLGNNLTTDPVAASSSSSKSKEHQRVQSSIAPWSAQTNAAASKGGPCLAEIQKAERRERQMEQRQMEMFVKRVRASAAAAVEAFDSMLKWNAPVKEVPVKSFAEIQAEEAKRLANEQIEMQRRRDHEQQQAASILGPGNNVGSSANNISAIWTGTKVWSTATSTGFWEDPIKFSAAIGANNSTAINTVGIGVSLNKNNISKQTTTGLQKSADITGSGEQNINQQNAVTRNIRKSQTVPVMQNAGSQNSRNIKNNNQQQSTSTAKQAFSNKVQPQKVVGNHGDGSSTSDKKSTSKIHLNAVRCGTTTSNIKRDEYENEFIAWCTKILNNMNTKLDVPTFVTFLRDLESPYEVKDYIRMYLGENKESTDFGKQFLERRSKYKNLQRAQNAHNDDMCKPAPAITPSGNDSTDNKGKHKKLKKNKMTKLDARILGFSVTAAEGRTNVGDRVYVDTP
ncbi:GIGYF family protein CG11148 isoform X2 [Ceratitis capitata]|nr:GIGYF family protein CG11148 isoform X2 [Ceratitis capitata]XP_012154916.1 GIGYF family protein CG11148 isoform X2 [Ceratitis capitata]XP_020712833.1 GIGYF family protein CG11148 isoform X2 [Ceratitis capitata]